MPIDPKGDPWSGATYKGFSGGPPTPPKAPTRRRPTRALLIGGVAGALALGVLFGLVLRPELIGSKSAPAAAPQSPPAQLATPGAAQVPIAVNPPAAATEPIPRAPGRLETLPPEMAAAARAQTPPAAANPPAISVPPAESSSEAAGAPISPPGAGEDAPSYRASFDCATARPGAEEMVCSDPSLAAADRQMARAYRRALGSGVEPADLRQEQRDWVAIREDAAHRSRQALADVYAQRIQELDEIADSAPPGMGEDAPLPARGER